MQSLLAKSPLPRYRAPMRLKPSTRRFFSEARRTPDYSLFDFLHAYIYGRWPYLYIGIATGEHPIPKTARRLIDWCRRPFRPAAPYAPRIDPRAARAFADGYHGKVVSLEAARQLVQIDKPVALPDLEHVVPYRQARDIILENPDHIALLDCPCRASRSNPCLPLDVCLVIGEPFASFIVEHQPDRSRWITAEEALAILAAEDARGHVHHAFFKNAMLNRFYAICNCCACCCGALQAQRLGVPMLASSGYVARVDVPRCIACGTCVSLCQFHALSLDAQGARVDAAACMGCGVCTDKCPQDALALVRDPARGDPLEIRRLLAERAQ